MVRFSPPGREPDVIGTAPAATSLFDVSNLAAIVSGGAHGGLGYHSAVALAGLGARVMVTDHGSRIEDLHRTAEEIRAVGGTCVARTCDVESESDVKDIVSTAMEEFGSVNALAHHAGVMLRKDALDTTRDEWDHILSINLTGTWLMNRAVARCMIDGEGGAIVNTSSLYANIVGPLPESAYYASKSGVVNLTRGLAMEWAQHGIRVNCVAPGVFYPTRMTAPLADDPSRLESMAERTMLKRLGRPDEDLAGPVVFLLSPASSYMTGQLMHVDGGWTSW